MDSHLLRCENLSFLARQSSSEKRHRFDRQCTSARSVCWPRKQPCFQRDANIFLLSFASTWNAEPQGTRTKDSPKVFGLQTIFFQNILHTSARTPVEYVPTESLELQHSERKHDLNFFKNSNFAFLPLWI